MHDLVIRGGTVVDGTGAPRRHGRRRHRRRPHHRGRRASTARRAQEIDADGAARHARLRRRAHALRRPGHLGPAARRRRAGTASPPSSWATAASASRPVRPDRHEWLIGLMEGVEDIPGTALHEGIQWDWETFPEYLDALERTPRAIDVGTQVPHGAVRAYVMGERGAAQRARHRRRHRGDGAPSCADGIEAGALGFSTVAHDRPPRHRRRAGARHLRRRGRAVRHRPGAGRRSATACSSSRRPARAARRPATRPTPTRPRSTGSCASAEATGVPVTFLIMQSHVDARPVALPDRRVAARPGPTGRRSYPQVASRCFGMLVGHQSRANPFRTRPTYQGAASTCRSPSASPRLRDPEVRAAHPRRGPAARRARATLAAQMQSSMFERAVPARRRRPTTSRRADTALARDRRARGRAAVEEVAYDAMLAARRTRAAAATRCSTSATAATTRSTR